MSRYAFIWSLQNGRIPVGEGSWTLEVNKEFQTDRDSLTLPLETKQFAGLRATARAGTIERLFSVALTGLSATATAGTPAPVVITWDSFDSFTGTNGDLLTGHTQDIYQSFGTWSTIYDPSLAEPTIQTNRLRGGAGVYAANSNEPYPTVDPWWIEAKVYRRNTTGSTDEVNGIIVGVSDTGFGLNGWAFGWNELNDYWELRRWWGGTSTSIATDSSTDVFTGSGQERTIRLKITGFYYDHTVECQVNGVTVATYNETVFPIDPSYGWGVHFGGDTSIDIDEIGAFSLAPKLTGHRLTTSAGTIVAGNIQLTGLSASASAGLLGVGGGGGAVTQALTGLSCTASQGTGMRGWQSVGSDGVKFDLSPNLKHTWNFNTTFHPGYVRSQFVYKDGSLWGAGTQYNNDSMRSGLFEISESAETTLPWVDNGSGITGVNSLTTDTGSVFVDGIYFPRSGLSQSAGYQYNAALMEGPYTTISRDGTILTSWSRAYAQLPYKSFSGYASHDIYGVPQFGEIEPTNNYNGPEFRVNRAQLADQNRGTQHLDVIGMYALTDGLALAFYPRPYDSTISVSVELCGLHAVTARGTITRSATGEAGGGLLGYTATTAQGTLTPSVDGDIQVRLTGLRIELNEPNNPFGQRNHNVYPESTDLNIVPAFRQLKGGVWSDEVVPSTFTGATRVWALAGSLVVAHSGYGDIIHCVYASSRALTRHLSDEYTYDVTHFGVLTVDANTKQVLSHTLYPVGAITPLWTPFALGVAGVNSHGVERTVAKCIRLDNGTWVTQFLLRGHIVHLQWTDAAPHTATLTVKDKDNLTTAALAPGWDSLESRAGRVYHVLYAKASTGVYDVAAQYNDATNPTDDWWYPATETTTGSSTVSGALDSFGENHSFFAGQGKDKTWLYSVASFSPSTTYENLTVWVDFWKNQLPIFSVAAQGVVGRVGIVINPNVQLTGLRATTSTDSVGLFPLVDGSKVGRLTGKQIVARTLSGYDLPTYAPFFIDNFTGSGALTSHTADTGQSWNEQGAENFTLDNGVWFGPPSVYSNGNTWDSFVYAYPTLTPPSNDYCVKSRFSGNRTQIVTITNVINEGVGARVGVGNGYWFGFNNAEDCWFLMKYHPSEGIILARYDAAWSDKEFSIEVSGNKPARVQCHIDGIRVIDYTDSSAPYFYSGAPGICTVLGSSNYSFIDYINAGTHDGTVLILQGHQALLSQGVLVVAGGLTGLRANTARGVISPQVSYLTLTGLRADTYQGTLTPGNIELVGLAATTAAGTIIGSSASPVVIALTGMRAYGYGGVLSLLNRELMGLRADARMGSLTWLAESFEQLVGKRATTSIGVLTPADTITITGYALTTGAGIASPTVSAPYYSTGLAASARGGLLTASVANQSALTGLAATTAQGTLVPATSVGSTLTGQSATASQGTLVPQVTVGLTGHRATARLGQIVPLLVVTPTGQQAVTNAGTAQVLLNIALTGQATTADFGEFGQRIDGFVTLVGVYATGRVADLSQGMPPPEDDEALFATIEVDDLFFIDDDEEEFVRVLS